MFARLAIVSALVVGSVTLVVAQNKAITERKTIMKGVGAATGNGGKMAKGELPFDLKAARQIFATYADASRRMGRHFPKNSMTGDETTAAPKIWEDGRGFRAALAKFGREAAVARRSTRDLDSFKAAFGNVTKNCAACHDVYRIKKG